MSAVFGGFNHLVSAGLYGPPVAADVVGKLFNGPDWQDGGPYRVVGTCAISGAPDIPVSRRVRLICAVSARLVREAWSSPAGNYTFENVRHGPWIVLAHDHTGEFNAVVADNILGDHM